MIGYRTALIPSLLFLAVAMAGMVWKEVQLVGEPWGFPLDDSWIHMAIARNWAYGLGFGMNPGEPVTASTSIPWSFIVGLLHWLLAGKPVSTVILGVKCVGTLFAVLTIVGYFRILRHFCETTTELLFAGLVVTTAFPLAWGALSGMEVPLVTTACVWALAFQLDWLKNPTSPRALALSVLLWGFASTTRPEVVMISFFMIAATARGTGMAIKSLAGWYLLWASCFIPAGVFNWWISGAAFPSTFNGTMTERSLVWQFSIGGWDEIGRLLWASPAKYLGEIVFFAYGENQVLFLAMLATPVLLWKLQGQDERFLSGSLLPTLWWAFACYPVLALVIGYLHGTSIYTIHHGRYIGSSMPLAALVAAIATLCFWRAHGHGRWGRMLLVICLALSVFRYAELPATWAKEVQNIQNLQVKLGMWLGERLPPEMTLAINDIGAIAYFGKQRIIDLEGLSTPEVIPFKRQGKIIEFIELKKPDALLIFPTWFPKIVERFAAKDLFFPRMMFVIDENVTSGGDEKVLVTMPWSRHLPASWPSPIQQVSLAGYPVPVPKRIDRMEGR